VLENWHLSRLQNAPKRITELVGPDMFEPNTTTHEPTSPRPTANNTRRQKRLFAPKTLNLIQKIRNTTARYNNGTREEIWPIDINKLEVGVGDNLSRQGMKNVGWAAKPKKTRQARSASQARRASRAHSTRKGRKRN
jgi:hypothetical protein